MEIENTNHVIMDSELENAPKISIFEAAIMLEKIGHIQNEDNRGIVGKTILYLDKFNKYKIPETRDNQNKKLVTLRNAFDRYGLDQYECSKLTDLLPQEPAEAFSLLPSLKEKNITDEQMKDIIKHLKDLQT